VIEWVAPKWRSAGSAAEATGNTGERGKNPSLFLGESFPHLKSLYNRKRLSAVIPKQAGIQYFQVVAENLDPVLQRADVPGLFRHSGAGRNPEVFEKTAPRHKTVSGGDEKG
jgi:hypothetical protein